MEKKIYYQAQFSEDGEHWRAFTTGREYNVRESLEEIEAVYDRMIEYHKKPYYSHCKYHRIVKFVVESEIIENEQ